MNIVLKAIPVAMGVAVVVLSLLDKLEMRAGFTMLGIGLSCVGIHLLSHRD